VDLDQQQLAVDEILSGHIGDTDDVDQLVELFVDLFDDPVIADYDQGDAGSALLYRLAGDDALNIVAAGAEEPDDARHHPGAVLHFQIDDMSHQAIPLSISFNPAPAGTIGKTFSSSLIMNSTMAGPA